ncbi:hypothetical protein CBR_g30345 [Chara braunii]|uniref:Uncharacterized protein n=1 Tax=Chara braunii TaxID=69332 RepID=A0A388JXC9_CHABU|nr:hypothetical protein CBR_g30345 [Chara braunii]|eukprot:GBG62392.1 hypothetical protein CBR_g30345 [Chara braunii]
MVAVAAQDLQTTESQFRVREGGGEEDVGGRRVKKAPLDLRGEEADWHAIAWSNSGLLNGIHREMNRGRHLSMVGAAIAVGYRHRHRYRYGDDARIEHNRRIPRSVFTHRVAARLDKRARICERVIASTAQFVKNR